MQVILLEKIRNLGELGDQVNVKPGYGRNYLIPRGKAAVANAKNKAEFEARRAELEKAQVEALAKAKERAEKMTGATVQIVRKVGEEGKLFGSVGTHDIADAMTAAGFPLARAEIHLPEGPIKAVGDHEIPVSLHPEVNFKIIVSVIGES
ncbi:MAG: 50S ribosomal protein L9 [Gammaproteobacteria bacterium]|nr:50S ribosomal protein L9 [Gammaproteobacteria bacterium]